MKSFQEPTPYSFIPQVVVGSNCVGVCSDTLGCQLKVAQVMEYNKKKLMIAVSSASPPSE